MAYLVVIWANHSGPSELDGAVTFVVEEEGVAEEEGVSRASNDTPGCCWSRWLLVHSAVIIWTALLAGLITTLPDSLTATRVLGRGALAGSLQAAGSGGPSPRGCAVIADSGRDTGWSVKLATAVVVGNGSLAALAGVFGDFGFNTTLVVRELAEPGLGAASTSITSPDVKVRGGGMNFVDGSSR